MMEVVERTRGSPKDGVKVSEREGRGEGQRCEAASSGGGLSDADRDTFAPELWNCVV